MWGKSSDLELANFDNNVSLNPRFVGQVFRPQVHLGRDDRLIVLIPDLWGKSSDGISVAKSYISEVLIPDLWGKSSDRTKQNPWVVCSGLNPRFVGQVFRLEMLETQPAFNAS